MPPETEGSPPSAPRGPLGPGDAARTPRPETSGEPSFESSLSALNELVARLESGTLGLSESITAYERGVTLVRQLHEQLADVEERVRLLVRIDADGRPVLEPTSPEALGREKPARTPGSDESTPAEEPAAPGGSPPRTRSGRSKRLPGMEDARENSRDGVS